MNVEIVHLVDLQHGMGWCPATTGVGTERLSETTCRDCLNLWAAEHEAGDAP